MSWDQRCFALEHYFISKWWVKPTIICAWAYCSLSLVEKGTTTDAKHTCQLFQVHAVCKYGCIVPKGYWRKLVRGNQLVMCTQFDLAIKKGKPQCHTFLCLHVTTCRNWATTKKGVPSAVGFPHCAGSGERLFLSPKPYPHKCAEAGARHYLHLQQINWSLS